jgi:hypothetical protein
VSLNFIIFVLSGGYYARHLLPSRTAYTVILGLVSRSFPLNH